MAVKPEKPKRGRPRIEFDQKIADRICEQIMAGKSLRSICLQKAMPTKKVALRWLEEHPAFATQYAKAREQQADGYFDELMDLQKQANADNANAIRVRADIIKWACSKLKPKKYGERLAVDAEVKVDTPRWARDLYGITQQSRPEEQLLNWPREDKFERARRMLSELYGFGLELEQHWHIPGARDACKALIDALTPAMSRVVDGMPAQEPEQPKALPGPREASQTEPTTRAREDDGDVIDGNAVVI